MSYCFADIIRFLPCFEIRNSSLHIKFRTHFDNYKQDETGGNKILTQTKAHRCAEKLHYYNKILSLILGTWWFEICAFHCKTLEQFHFKLLIYQFVNAISINGSSVFKLQQYLSSDIVDNEEKNIFQW